jgi:putative hydrolases of HD superfamily
MSRRHLPIVILSFLHHFISFSSALQIRVITPSFKRDTQLTMETNECAANSDKSPDARKAIEFARLIGRLKTTPRTGWVRRNVPNYESVADHSWRVAALSLLLSNNDDNQQDSIDVGKCMQLAIVHDLAECIIGDIAPDDNMPNDVKRQKENDAMDSLASLLQDATGATQPSNNLVPETLNTSSHHNLVELFQEYEDRKSKEAIAVKDLDLLDMIIQADEYEERYAMDLSDFFDNTPIDRFQNTSVRRIAEEIHQQRKSRRLKELKMVETIGLESKDKSRLLSKSEQAFIEEHSRASHLSADSIEQIILAFKQWDVKN